MLFKAVRAGGVVVANIDCGICGGRIIPLLPEGRRSLRHRHAPYAIALPTWGRCRESDRRAAHERSIGRCNSSTARRQPLGKLDRLDQAALVGNPLAGDVEGGAVVDGGADDRQAEGDVDAGKIQPFAGCRIDLEAQ